MVPIAPAQIAPAQIAPVRLAPVRLACRHVVLEPLDVAHADDLRHAVQDGEIWTSRVTQVPKPADVSAEIEHRLRLQARGLWVPFAVLAPGGRAIGMTSYLNIEAETPRLEIGATWYAKSDQGTAINPAAKRLLLAHAFETIGCLAVELRTHHLNAHSRRAIERLGAHLDGILRHHRRMPDGTLRDTCVYSITAADWPAIRASLDARLEAYPKDRS